MATLLQSGPSAIDLTSGPWMHLINGELVDSAANFGVTDPATGAIFAQCPSADGATLDRAVAAARRAFPVWSRTPIGERRALLRTLAGRIRDNAEALHPLLTREQGKPLADARLELQRTADHIEGMASLPLDPVLLSEGPAERIEMRWRPIGVVGAIAPWNVPVALGMHKVAHALYTGNTIVLKPSPYTPLTTLAIGALAADIFPRGVLNILAGGNELGAIMTSHPDIEKVSFTGSVATGKKVAASSAQSLKRVTLELGGNDPALVLADADVEAAADGIARSAFSNCGQICMAVKRVYVAAPLYDAMVAALSERARAISYGPGTAEGVRMGPIQNAMQYDKVKSVIERTRADPAAHFETGGTVPEGAGYFLPPTIVTGLGDDAPLVTEEQFGPVLPILRFEKEEEAIARANDTRFGLGASVWSRDKAHAVAIGQQLEAGQVWINRHGGNPVHAPFGGAKESGLGREHGVEGLRSYMEMQVVTVPLA
ncbi:MAG TPA: aldehyde dehydrogenase family protein [Sphingomonadaceae bacterium]|nr:aldehyde dehydrogenase family protein [Sphingomonadaceae bacterium]